MNTQLLFKLAQAKQQALLAERWGYRPQPTHRPSWMTHIEHWLGQTKTLRRAALNQ